MKCVMCDTVFDGMTCPNEWCNQEYSKCCKCGVTKLIGEMYEYRGSKLACENCIDEVAEVREFKRQEIINEESRKTKVFSRLDLNPDNPIGRANQEILKRHIGIASKESGRLKDYEGRND